MSVEDYRKRDRATDSLSGSYLRTIKERKSDDATRLDRILRVGLAVYLPGKHDIQPLEGYGPMRSLLDIDFAKEFSWAPDDLRNAGIERFIRAEALSTVDTHLPPMGRYAVRNVLLAASGPLKHYAPLVGYSLTEEGLTWYEAHAVIEARASVDFLGRNGSSCISMTPQQASIARSLPSLY